MTLMSLFLGRLIKDDTEIESGRAIFRKLEGE